MADRGGGRDRLSRRPARQRLNPAASSRGLFFLGPLTRHGPAAELPPPIAARFRHGAGGGRYEFPPPPARPHPVPPIPGRRLPAKSACQRSVRQLGSGVGAHRPSPPPTQTPKEPAKRKR